MGACAPPRGLAAGPRSHEAYVGGVASGALVLLGELVSLEGRRAARSSP